MVTFPHSRPCTVVIRHFACRILNCLVGCHLCSRESVLFWRKETENDIFYVFRHTRIGLFLPSFSCQCSYFPQYYFPLKDFSYSISLLVTLFQVSFVLPPCLEDIPARSRTQCPAIPGCGRCLCDRCRCPGIRLRLASPHGVYSLLAVADIVSLSSAGRWSCAIDLLSLLLGILSCRICEFDVSRPRFWEL